jgi:hypothetical protein
MTGYKREVDILNEKIKGLTVESLADELMPNMKRHPEENRKIDKEVETEEDKLVILEAYDNVEKNPLVIDHSDVSTEDR